MRKLLPTTSPATTRINPCFREHALEILARVDTKRQTNTNLTPSIAD